MTRRWGPALATLVLGLAVWTLFHPALMSEDSIAQYGEATVGKFFSWHPPLMAIVLSGVLAAGGSLGMLMLGQCLAGAFGVHALAAACLDELFPQRLSPRLRSWLPVAVLALLLLPASPLAFYLMTFWKDAWEMVVLLWLGVLAWRLCGSRGPPSKPLVAGLVLLGAVCGMVRHNAVVALPFLGLFLWAETRRRGVRFAAAWAAAPLLAFLALNPLLEAVFAVHDLSPQDWILSLDLAGVCARSDQACAGLPYTRSHILDRKGLRARYRAGDLGSVFWEEPRLVDPGMVAREHRPQIRAEYRRALLSYPGVLVRLKLAAFWELLGTEKTFYFFQDRIAENPYGLALHERSAGARDWLARSAKGTSESPWRWLWGVHLVWLLANLAWLAGLLAAAWRTGEGRLRSVALSLLVPLGYALSYLTAAPVHDFRFLYPSALVIQVLTLTWLLAQPVSQPGRRSSRSKTT